MIGLGAPDDAAAYRLNAGQVILSTADFFAPVVDDPYAYGAIAAANALSDIYAMGGEPLFALNLAAFPEDLPAEVTGAILRGGAEKVREAGAAIAGGHSITDREPKYGLAVTGLAHPDALFTKGGARPGDRLVLTKPLGAGVLTTAAKNGPIDPAHLEAAITSMARLNRAAAQAARRAGARGVTDITGYSLLGHAHEMAHLSGVRLALEYAALPWLAGARDHAAAWHFPGGAGRNADYFGRWVTFERPLEDWEKHLLFDPQTSGGLLIAAPAGNADALLADLAAAGAPGWEIGRAEPGQGELLIR